MTRTEREQSSRIACTYALYLRPSSPVSQRWQTSACQMAHGVSAAHRRRARRVPRLSEPRLRSSQWQVGPAASDRAARPSERGCASGEPPFVPSRGRPGSGPRPAGRRPLPRTGRFPWGQEAVPPCGHDGDEAVEVARDDARWVDGDDGPAPAALEAANQHLHQAGGDAPRDGRDHDGDPPDTVAVEEQLQRSACHLPTTTASARADEIQERKRGDGGWQQGSGMDIKHGLVLVHHPARGGDRV